jgi:hypothetical protein
MGCILRYRPFSLETLSFNKQDMQDGRDEATLFM